MGATEALERLLNLLSAVHQLNYTNFKKDEKVEFIILLITIFFVVVYILPMREKANLVETDVAREDHLSWCILIRALHYGHGISSEMSRYVHVVEMGNFLQGSKGKVNIKGCLPPPSFLRPPPAAAAFWTTPPSITIFHVISSP